MAQRKEDLLFRLPDALSFDIVDAWLFMKDIVRLDSAYCTRETRQHLLEQVFQSPQFMLGNGTEYSQPPNNYIEWMFLRQIASRDLFISNRVDTIRCRQYLNQFGQSIEKLTLTDLTHTTALLLISLYCPNVKTLVCISCLLSEAVVDILYNCKELKQIHFDCCTETWSAISNLSNLGQLNHLHLETIVLHQDNNDLEMTNVASAVLTLNAPIATTRLNLNYARRSVFSLFCSQLSQYTHLQALSLYGIMYLHDNILSQIVACCPTIVHLDVSSCKYLTDASVINIAEGLSQLRSLCILAGMFTDISLLALAEHRHSTLEVLHCGNTATTSEGLNAVLRACAKLHTVQLVNNVHMRGLDWKLLGNITTLHINLSCYNKAADLRFFGALIKHCKKLQNLYVNYCFADCKLPFLKLSARSMPALRLLSVFAKIDEWDYCFYKQELREHQSDVLLLKQLQERRPELEICLEDSAVDFDVVALEL